MIFLLPFIAAIHAIALDTLKKDSVCSAAKAIVDGEFNYYEGLQYGGTVGTFQPPYYWWHAGEAFNGMIDYFTFCDPQNSTLQSLLLRALYSQQGANHDYMPANQTNIEANDDQCMWGMAIMQAAERHYPVSKGQSDWADLADNIWSSMSPRWDTDNCNGGLRWQISSSKAGYNYKNLIANGCFFQLLSRLAKFSGDQKYVDAANKVWDWLQNDISLVSGDGNGGLKVEDGANIVNGKCSQYDTTEWLYNSGVIAAGTAYMYNHTGDSKWLDSTKRLVQHASTLFFQNAIMYEPACMTKGNCNNDQRAFRSLLSRCLGLVSVVAQSTTVQIRPLLQKSAQAAAQSCSGGTDRVTCGQDWSKSGWDGVYGLGEQMLALETVLSVIVQGPRELN